MKNLGRLFLGLFIIGLSLGMVSAIYPSGGTLTPASNATAPADTPLSHAAIAGNVTEMDVTGYTTTQAWQGYFGNVTGTIQLADASDNVMYNWSLASPQGEIYSSTSNAVTWGSIECFNWSKNGTTVESIYNINATDVDGINETFSTGNGHDLFYTNSKAFTEGECMSTQIYDNSGTGNDNSFEEVLLWDGDDLVFVSLLEQDSLGFDGNSHDFEMIVLEDGHGTDVATTNYYFYVELE